MAFIYNVHRVLKSVRADEVSTSKFHFSDETGREVSYENSHIKLSLIRTMHDEENLRYERLVKDMLFFGEEIPVGMFPDLDIENIADNVNNNATGYCFLDDPRNNFSSFRDAYGRWLLSDPDRAEDYVYLCGGELIWKPEASLALLEQMEVVRGVLAPGVSYSTLLQVRGAEFARSLLRNTTGALRNLRIEMHLLAYVAIQDKTSHKHLKERYIPHPITREWATSLIIYLVIFRPFEEMLVNQLLGGDALHRYRIQMWPGIRSTMSADKFSSSCASMTLRYLGKRITPLPWRSLMTAFAQYLPDSKAYEANKEYYVDTAMMHSSKMSNAFYGRSTNRAEQSDFRVTIGCIQAGLDFQKHVGIGQARPFSLRVASEIVPATTTPSEGDIFFLFLW